MKFRTKLILTLSALVIAFILIVIYLHFAYPLITELNYIPPVKI